MDRLFLFITFHQVFIILQTFDLLLTYFWLDSDESHCQMHGCRAQNLWLKNSKKEFAEWIFLSWASHRIKLRVAFRVRSHIQDVGSLFLGESRRGSLSYLNRPKTRKASHCNIWAAAGTRSMKKPHGATVEIGQALSPDNSDNRKFTTNTRF